MRKDLRNIINALKDKGYVIYDQPYQLNIIGVRNEQSQPNKFDDQLYVFYKDAGWNWELKEFPITTDTGTYWLENPMSSLGSAMLKEGQYIDAYKQGLHKGQYTALVQQKPVTTYRDYDRNAVFDIGQRETTGLYGINIHKAGADSQDVNKWSAGCQVFQKSEDFQEFMQLTDKHKASFGNNFTYTLLDERAVARKGRKFLLYGGISTSVVAIGISLYFIIKNKINK